MRLWPLGNGVDPDHGQLAGRTPPESGPGRVAGCLRAASWHDRDIMMIQAKSAQRLARSRAPGGRHGIHYRRLPCKP